MSVKPGTSEFLSITFSNPLPIEQIKKRDGIIPNRVAKKKLNIFTLNMHGKTLDNANGIPPTNL